MQLDAQASKEKSAEQDVDRYMVYLTSERCRRFSMELRYNNPVLRGMVRADLTFMAMTSHTTV
jgi:hypothetical protein